MSLSLPISCQMGERVMRKKEAKEKTRKRILAAAAQLFADQSYLDTTIAQIAQAAKVSEATVYEYFNGKEGLLIQIPSSWVLDGHEYYRDTLFGIKGGVNKLRKYLWEYVRNVTSNPTYAKVVFLQLKTNKNFLETEAYQVVREGFKIILDIIDEGKEAGEFGEDLDPYMARMVILGTLEHMFIRWLLKDCSYDLFEQLEKVFDIIVDGLRAKRNNNGRS